MSRISWTVPLLLATGVALASDAPDSSRAAGAAETQAQKQQAKGEQAKNGQAADDNAAKEQAKEDADAKLLSGMSILGNQEAPKALVIVPWKSSELGNALGISPLLDDSRQPIDRVVFMRALSYYEIRSDTTRHDGTPAGGRDTSGGERNAAQSATATHRRSS